MNALTFVLAVLVANNPTYVAQGVAEFKTLAECQQAIVTVKDKDLKAAAVCVAIPHNYI